jgi:hypothetical protein
VVAQHVRENGTSEAVLVLLTRGLLESNRYVTALASATNQWLADEWLSGEHGPMFPGTIRVNPRDPVGAVAEINRWADDSRFVQVAVPLESGSVRRRGLLAGLDGAGRIRLAGHDRE